MIPQFKNLTDLLDYFKDEQTCIDYFAQKRWGGTPRCPYCNHDKVYKINQGKRFKCASPECYKIFSVKVGSIFEDSNIPLRKWFVAIYLLTSHKKGISSVQLAKDIGICQKSAWHLEHRIREMLKVREPIMLNNSVEVDETYIGGKEGNRHLNKKHRSTPPLRSEKDKGVGGRSVRDKAVVLGLVERAGKVIAVHVPDAKAKTIIPQIEKHIAKGSTMLTDEWYAYGRLTGYTHKTVQHGLKIYVQGEVHTNTIENFWSVLKRGLYGIYHFTSRKHLDRYLDEFCARYNTRELGEVERFDNFLAKSTGTTLTWNRLVQAQA